MAQEIYNLYLDSVQYNNYLLYTFVSMSVALIVVFVISYFKLRKGGRDSYRTLVTALVTIFIFAIPNTYFAVKSVESVNKSNSRLEEYLLTKRVLLDKVDIRRDLMTDTSHCYGNMTKKSYCYKVTISDNSGYEYDALIPTDVFNKLDTEKKYDVSFIQEDELKELLSKDFNLVTSVLESIEN